MSSAKVLKLIGSHGSKEDRTITVVPGWNWIAYNNTQTASVADALAGMDPQDGDMIKGKNGIEWKRTYHEGDLIPANEVDICGLEIQKNGV